MKSRRALITGGAGFIGSYLAEDLLEKGFQVRVLDSLVPQVHGAERRFPTYLDPRVERALGDVRDKETVSCALEGMTHVFHLAALTGVGQSMYQVDEYTQTNIGGTATLLQCLIDRGQELDRLVLASSRAIYGEGKYVCTSCGTVYPQSRSIDQLDAKQWELTCPRCSGPVSSRPTDESTPPKPSSIYAITKKAQEELVLCAGQAFGWPVVILRCFNVYGSRQSPSNPYTGVITTFLSRLAAGQPLELYEDGQMKRDFVHVRDMVSATIAAAETAKAVGQVINVGSGEATTIAQMAGALTEITGTTQPTRRIDVARVGDVRHVVADIRVARELLGYEPKVSIREGLAETVGWFRRQGEQVDKSDQARQELEEHNLLRQ